jgi:hypothetical protein
MTGANLTGNFARATLWQPLVEFMSKPHEPLPEFIIGFTGWIGGLALLIWLSSFNQHVPTPEPACECEAQIGCCSCGEIIQPKENSI